MSELKPPESALLKLLEGKYQPAAGHHVLVQLDTMSSYSWDIMSLSNTTFLVPTFLIFL